MYYKEEYSRLYPLLCPESQSILYHIQMQINSHICGLDKPEGDKSMAIFTSYAMHQYLPSRLMSKGKV